MKFPKIGKINIERKNHWKNFLKEFYNEKTSEHFSLVMALVERDIPNFEKAKDNVYLALCRAHILSILQSYPTINKYSIPVLCRSIIEVCVKSHFNWKLDQNMDCITYRIENTKWNQETKNLAIRVYKEGSSFTHGNAKQITKSLVKYLKQNYPNRKITKLQAHSLINYYIAFNIMVCIDLINEEFGLNS